MASDSPSGIPISSKKDKVKVFEAPSERKGNKDFYEYFKTVISNTKEELFITGEGFNCETSASRDLAESFQESFKSALKKGF